MKKELVGIKKVMEDSNYNKLELKRFWLIKFLPGFIMV